MRHRSRISIVVGAFLALTLIISACSPTNPELNPAPDEEIALFGDTDIDAAILDVSEASAVNPSRVVDAPEGDELDLSSMEAEFSSQAVLPSASGLIAYIRHDPGAFNPWRIYLFDQASNTKTLVYKGRRELQSVASDTTGDTVVFVARRTASPASSFEVYSLDVSGGTVTRLTHTSAIDEANVSLTADASIAVWEGERSGRRAVRWREFGVGSFVLVNGRPNVMPSIAGDHIAFIRVQASGNHQVRLLAIGSGTLTNVISSSLSKKHPSPSADGNSVAWTETLASGSDRLRIKDLGLGTTTTIFSNATGIEHAHMTSDGLFVTYGLLKSGFWHVFTREIGGGVARGTFGAGKDHLGMFWQVPAASTISGQITRGTGPSSVNPSVSSQDPSKSATTALQLQPAIDDLVAAAQRTGSVRVIATLNQRFVPEGFLSPALAQAQKDDIAAAQQALLQRLAAFQVRGVKTYHIAPLIAFELDAAALRALANDPMIARIEEDIAVPPTLAESIPVVDADLAWSAGYDGTGWATAILDTGVDKTHSFVSNVVSEACYSSTVTGQSVTVCPDGSDASTAVGSGVNCSLAVTGCNHGTHVAGIAAGTSASFSGVAKDADIIAVQVFSRFDSAAFCGSSPAPCVLSYTSDQILGLQRVLELHNTTSLNIASVNMSLGGGGPFNAACDTASQKPAIDSLRSVGIATVIASGNNGFTTGISSPACISTAVSVGSTGDGSLGATVDVVSSFSNSGALLDLLAPGQWINSSVPGGGFSNFQGTSMATPHIAGAWAVMRDKYPSTASGGSVTDVLNCLVTTGVSVTDGRNGLVRPRLDLDDALNCTPPPPATVKVRLFDVNTGALIDSVDADSSDFYTFDNVPSGQFFVQAFVDSNSNSIQDSTEDAGAFSTFANSAVMSVVDTSTPGSFTADFATGTPSELEPNEGFGTDNVLLNGAFLNGAVIDLAAGPFDFFILPIPAAGSYTVETFGNCGIGNGRADTILTLYDGAQAFVAENDDTVGLCSRIDFTATGPGMYYVRVSAFESGANVGELPYTVGLR